MNEIGNKMKGLSKPRKNYDALNEVKEEANTGK